jgi:hypothetical protein
VNEPFRMWSPAPRIATGALLGVLLCHTGCALRISRIDGQSQGQLTCSATPARNYFSRVLIVVLENEDFKDASRPEYLGGVVARYIAKYGGREFTNFHALFHHSYPNYLAMVGGRLFPEVSSADSDEQQSLSEVSIADRLTATGLTWKNYAEDYPGDAHCPFLGDTAGRYVRRHVPFLSFIKVQQNGVAGFGNVVSATDLDQGFMHDAARSTFPNYAFYSPNVRNDGHNTSLAFASKWLKEFLKTIPANRWNDTLVVVTFDEAAGSNPANNKIYTAFLGNVVAKGPPVDAPYNHYNVLRTIEENFGLAPMADGDGMAIPILGIWTNKNGDG